jgi:hypothetical protein
MAKTITITVSVSADGFSCTPADDGGKIDVFQGDTLDFKPAGPNPPASVTVTAKKPASPAATLFGVADVPVPSRHTVETDDGVFFLTAGVHEATVRVSKGGRPIDPDPSPNPRNRS